jgi:hypothetical protein
MVQAWPAADYLRKGLEILEARAREHDRPGGERSAGQVANAFNAIKGREVLTDTDVWMLLVLLKLVRHDSAPGPHNDSAMDAAVYSALMGESKGRIDTPEFAPHNVPCGPDPADLKEPIPAAPPPAQPQHRPPRHLIRVGFHKETKEALYLLKWDSGLPALTGTLAQNPTVFYTAGAAAAIAAQVAGSEVVIHPDDFRAGG